MMMIVPNSLCLPKIGAPEEEEEEAAGQRNAGLTGTPTPGADAPIRPTRSWVSDARNRKKTRTVVWCFNP